MPRLVWKTLHASELVEAHESNALEQLLPKKPAVYLWRRRLVAPSSCLSSAETFRDWVMETVSIPAAHLTRRPLSHCVWTEGLQVGGGSLTGDKEQTLHSISGLGAQRRLVVDYVESLTEFTPPIYVGTAVNLKSRVSQHLRGETSLIGYVETQLGLSWTEIDFRYLVLSASAELSDDARSLLLLMELVTQRVLAPFGTDRPG